MNNISEKDSGNTTQNSILYKKQRDKNIVAEFLKALFGELEKRGIRYCVIHSYERLPESLYSELGFSDVDMAIESTGLKNIDTILLELAREYNLKLIQKLYYDIPKCYYYVLSYRDNFGALGFIQLDFLNDEFGVNNYLFPTEEFLAERKRYKNFYIPSPSIEAVHLLIKKVIKGKLLPLHQRKLMSLYKENEQQINKLVTKYFGEKNLPRVRALMHNQKYPSIQEVLKKLRLSLAIKNNLTKPLRIVLKFYWSARRVWYRVLHPTGFIIAFIAPDGGGKSTIAKEVLAQLRQGFRRIRHIHWRPSFLPPPRNIFKLWRYTKNNEIINIDPHHVLPQNPLISLARFFYYTFDYILGYLIKLRWAKIRTALVAMDRYYYDFLVDPKRFRLNIPKWLPKMFLPLIPKPDLVFYLDNDAKNIVKRKSELTLKEIERQVEAFRKLLPKLPNSYLIRTEKPINEVVFQVTSTILEKKASQTRKFLKLK